MHSKPLHPAPGGVQPPHGHGGMVAPVEFVLEQRGDLAVVHHPLTAAQCKLYTSEPSMDERFPQLQSAVPHETIVLLLQRSGTILEAELRGRSMGMRDRTRLRIACKTDPVLTVGDIVAFRAAKDLLTVHRVVGRGLWGPAKAFVLTRGDGAILTDYPVPRANILGVVREWEENGAWRVPPGYVGTGWRWVLTQLTFWPVLGALQIHYRLALALTICGIRARSAWLSVAAARRKA